MREVRHIAMYYVGQPWIGSSIQFDGTDNLPKRGDTVYVRGGHRLLVLRDRQELTRNELTGLVTHRYDCELKKISEQNRPGPESPGGSLLAD